MKLRRRYLIPMAVFGVFMASLILFVSAQKMSDKNGGCGCDNFDKATGEFISNEKQAYFENNPIIPPIALLPDVSNEEVQVLGEQTGEEKWIEIDLSEQKLKAWQGNDLYMESLISSGKWAPTPTGEFRIWAKYKYTKMSGGNKANNTYYYLPNVPYTMYFYQGYGLHGTYWHNNFGQPMSHGCVNLPTVNAEKLFYWTTPVVPSNKNSITATLSNPGTRVVIHE